jgi:hypothetical protein
MKQLKGFLIQVYQFFESLWALIFSVFSLIYTILVINPYLTYRQKDIFKSDNENIYFVNFLPQRNFIFFRNLGFFIKSLFIKAEFIPEVSNERFDEILSKMNEFLKNVENPPKFCFKGEEYLSEDQKKRLKDYTSSSNYQFFTLNTDNGAHLDSVKIAGEGSKYVIYCMARDMNYSKYIKDGSFQKLVDKTEATLISFNYRGIDRSKGFIFREIHLVNDTISQVLALINKGVKAEDITLYGHCLGGAIATLAAGSLIESGLPVRLFNDRSFKSISKFVAGFILPSSESSCFNPINHIRFLLGMTFYPFFLLPTASLAGWQMDAESSWKKINDAQKTYAVVKKIEDERVVQEDGIVHTTFASIAGRSNSHCYYSKCPTSQTKGHFQRMDCLKQSNTEDNTLENSLIKFILNTEVDSTQTKFNC